MATDGRRRVELHPLIDFAVGPAGVLVGLLLIRRLPTASDWAFPTANWILAGSALAIGFQSLRGSSVRRGLVSLSILCLLGQATLMAWDARFRPFISIDWPTEVPSNEAVVGGTLRSLEPAATALKLYVCVVSDTPGCYLDQHADAPSIRDGYWYGRIRFGNEHPDNDHGRPDFFVVAVAAGLDQLSLLPGTAGTPPRNSAVLVKRLRQLRPRVTIAGPFRVRKTHPGDPPFEFAGIEEQGSGKVTPLPPLRSPNYSVCPPLVLTWSNRTKHSALAVVEAWQDGRPYGRSSSASNYRIERWPEAVVSGLQNAELRKLGSRALKRHHFVGA